MATSVNQPVKSNDNLKITKYHLINQPGSFISLRNALLLNVTIFHYMHAAVDVPLWFEFGMNSTLAVIIIQYIIIQCFII